MGYTHYWTINDQLSEKAIEDIKKVVSDFRNIIQYEDDNPSDPLVSIERIRFNGKDENAYETFMVVPDSDDFCKTSEKPYDMPVCVTLLVLKHHFKNNMELKSDGFWVSKEDFVKQKLDGFWNEAIDYVKKKFGYALNLIPRIHENKYYSFDIE